MLREHLWVSTRHRMRQLVQWIEHLPPWLRPAFFGMGLLLVFALARGAVIILPIVVVVLLFKDPRLLVHQVIPVFLYLLAAGFLGGLLYGISEPFLKHLGRAGRILQYILGALVYFIFLVFFISPLIDRSKPPSLSSSGDWYFIGIMGIGVGLIMGLSAMSQKRENDAGRGAA